MWVAGRGGTRGRHRSDVSPLRGVWLYRRRHLARQNETLQVGGIFITCRLMRHSGGVVHKIGHAAICTTPPV